MDENASQSILMVGGILLAISVLSFFVYAIATFGGFANNMNAQIEGSEIQKYNQHFFQFDGRCNVTFQDVISTVNFVKDWNDQNVYSFDQVVANSVEYSANVYVVNSKGNTISVFGNDANSWIKKDTYSDNQKVKDVLNKLLSTPEYADYYYAVDVKTVDITSNVEKNYYTLHGNYGAANSQREKDIVINQKTGFIEKIYFTAVCKTNYPTFWDKFEIVNQQGKSQNITYTVQNKDYFKMTEIED